jgi:TusA-related sulfurtransferase
MKPEYYFIRVPITDAGTVSEVLNAWAAQGYVVVSHAEGSDEYTFVLRRSA